MAVLERLSDQDIQKYGGKWVAARDGKVLYAARSPKEVSDWLTQHGKSADLVYRVPIDGDPVHYFF